MFSVVTIFVAIIIITQMSCYQIKLKINVYAHFLCYFHTYRTVYVGETWINLQVFSRVLEVEENWHLKVLHITRTNTILKVVKRTGNVILNSAKVG